MPISEAARNDLYTGLAGAIGPANAETLMGLLAFHTADQVATKSDIAMLRTELKADIAGLDARVSRIETEMSQLTMELRELRRTTYRLSYATLVTIIAAMAAFQFIP
jgi:cell division protein FtsB